MRKRSVIIALAAAAGVLATMSPAIPAGEDGFPQAAPAAFELKMRVLEGVREKGAELAKAVTSSYLKFLTFANSESEEDIQTEAQIRKIYSLKDVVLLTEASLVWMRGKAEKAFHIFRLNGHEYLVLVSPGRLAERSHFRVEVYEQSDDMKSNLLDTEFLLPGRTAAVFGFEDTRQKPYFVTLRVVRWVEPSGGEEEGVTAPPAGKVGGVVGGVVQGQAVEPVITGEIVKPPKLIKQVDPVYPEIARQAAVEGIVILEATTDTYGRVVHIKVLRSIPLLDQAAVDALRQWVYEPAVIDGRPRPMTFTVTMRFALDDKRKPRTSGAVGGLVGTQDAEEFQGDAVRITGEMKPPKLIKKVAPVYPEIARQVAVEGVVILEAKADEKGDVVAVRVLRSVPLLDQAAVEAVKQWKYEPLVIDGKPRKVVFTVTVRFILDESRKRTLEKFAEGAVRIEREMRPPKLIKSVDPVYPETARQAAVEGVVILAVRTDVEGRVKDVIVLRSIPLLDQAAIDAVRQWVYEPFVVEGKPVPAVFTVTVRFALKT